METEATALLERLLSSPSPSGYEERIQEVARSYLRPHAEELTTDIHGNLIAGKNCSARPRLMFAGHCDQIGMLVSHVDDSGFVFAQPIGGWDPQQLVGQAMTIWTRQGPLPAVISRKPIHLLKDKERQQVVELDQLWLDCGSSSKAQTLERVCIGDPVTLQLNHRHLLNQLISGPGLDNKTGMWSVIEGFRRAAERGIECALFSVSTVQEEIGLRGAKTAAGSIHPDVAIAVDVTHASDCPTIDKQQNGDLRLGRGPVLFRGPNINPLVFERLRQLALDHRIPFQVAAIGRAASNDANVLQLHGGGVATGLVAIPNRYMHSAVEVCSLEDLDHAAELLALFAVHLSSTDDFRPRIAAGQGGS